MEAYRLKKIIILILLFLNLFLLGMLGRQLWQERSAQRRLEQELRRLYESSEMVLAEDVDLVPPPPDSLTLSRDLAAEASLAAFLLEEETEAQDQGGGIYSYSGRRGTVRFRSNGSFDYTVFRPETTDPMTLCRTFCETFGYQMTDQSLRPEGGSVTAVQRTGESSIHNAEVTFIFVQDRLVSLSGAYVSAAGGTPGQRSTVTRATALVRFLDYRSQSGLVCNAVLALLPVYELEAASTPLRLSAKWEITTDTGVYYVDCADGSIARG